MERGREYLVHKEIQLKESQSYSAKNHSYERQAKPFGSSIPIISDNKKLGISPIEDNLYKNWKGEIKVSRWAEPMWKTEIRKF